MLTFLRRISLSTTLSAAILAPSLAEETQVEAADQPLAEIIVPDLVRLKQRFADSIYGQAWNDPSNQRLRELFEKGLAEQLERSKQRDGINYQTVIQNIERGGARLIDLDANDPAMSQFQAYLSFTENGAIELMQLPTLNNAPMLEVEGADESFISEDGHITLSRFGSTIVLADPDNIAVPAQDIGIESDMETNISVRDLIETLIDLAYNQAPNQPPVDKKDIKQFLSQYDQFTHTVTIKTGGLFETIDYIGPEKAGVQTVDHAILKRLPDNALIAAAIGLKGRDLWTDHIRVFLDLAAQANPNESADDMIQNINNALNFFGVEMGISSIFEGLDGTFFLTVTPSVPFPAISIGIPRSDALDQLINALLVSQFNIIRPPEGQIETIPLRPGIPPLQLGFGKDYWFLSTDRVLTQKWLDDKTGGWEQSEAAQAALQMSKHDPFLIGGMDSKQVLNITQSLMGLAALGARGDDQANIQSITNLLQKIQLLAEPNYIVANQNGRDFHYDIYSLVGSGPVLMAPAAAIGAVRQQQRRRAWRTEQRKKREEALKAEQLKKPDSVDDL